MTFGYGVYEAVAEVEARLVASLTEFHECKESRFHISIFERGYPQTCRLDEIH